MVRTPTPKPNQEIHKARKRLCKKRSLFCNAHTKIYRMGKAKLTANMVIEAVNLISNGATNRDVCAYLGVHEGTWYRWLQTPKTVNQRELCEAIKKAEVKRKLWHIQQIQKASENGSWQASAWYLERKYPQEWSKAERTAEDPNAPAIENAKKVCVEIIEAANNQ